MAMYLLGTWEHGGITYYVQAISDRHDDWNVGVVALGPDRAARSRLLTGRSAARALEVNWRAPGARERARHADAFLHEPEPVGALSY
jgi:hypothetical protein